MLFRSIAGFMIVVMTASQFITQLQLVAKNMSPETKESPMYRQQKMMLYILPLVFVISGLSFPLGVMFYWLASNIWTMAQQYFVIRSIRSVPNGSKVKYRWPLLFSHDSARSDHQSSRSATDRHAQ